MPGSIPDAFASETFKGKSEGGPWGDKVEEIDWSTGEILDAIKQLGISERTFVIWTSDNGAGRLPEGTRGSNLPLKGWGYSTSEAAMRVPCIAWWPGKIPADTICKELVTTMDLLPTYRRLADADGVEDEAAGDERAIDGKDLWPLFAGQADASTPHESFFYYYMDQLQAVRSGKWKLYLELPAKRISPFKSVEQPAAELYDLRHDLSERHNLAAENPEVVSRLAEYAREARDELGDGDRVGVGQRPAGFVNDPVPQLMRMN